MPNDLLDFEEPVAGLLKEIEALNLMPPTPDRVASIARLEARVRELRAEIFAGLGPWQRLQVARHPNRPCTLDYVERRSSPSFMAIAGSPTTQPSSRVSRITTIGP